MSTTIKLRRGTSTAFSTNNPTLQAGEPAFETDTGKLKIGDGTTAYNSLAYIGDGLKNNTTASNSLAILGTTTRGGCTVIGSSSSSSYDYGTVIGRNAQCSNGSHATAIGINASASGQGSVAIGSSSHTSDSFSVAIGSGAQGLGNGSYNIMIGYNAKVDNLKQNAIQLGTGTNSTSGTLNFRSYQLVDSSGKIPNDRLDIDSTPTSGSSNTVSSGGVYTALDGRADTNLSNVTDTGYIKMADAGMPSDTYIDLTLGASGTTYTAPADGYYSINVNVDANGYISLNKMVNNIPILRNGGQRPSSGELFASLPVKKGDTMLIGYSGISSIVRFVFIYAQGSVSEYTPASNS